MLTDLSNDIANIIETTAPSVVQVEGAHRPASGLIFGPDLVITTGRAVGHDEHPHVRQADGEVLDADLAGFDPSTRIALLKVQGLNGPPLTPGPSPRVGQIAIAIARSWSNAVTATAGLVSIIGGPLPTGRRRAIEQVIRTSAPMHEGFAGGAFIGADGSLLGLATAASIRGLGVVIPATIAWTVAAELQRRGTLKRGYIGIAAQTVRIPTTQQAAAGVREALLVVGVKDDAPAAGAGLLVGDVLLSAEGRAVASPEDLHDLLVGEHVGRPMSFRLLRGGVPVEVTVPIAER